MSSGRLEGRTAIICGAGQTPGEAVGNGRATAVRFAQEGARILAADINLEAAQETVGEVTAAGGEAIAVRTDVADEDSVRQMVATAMDAWGRVDVLHNNVGVSLAGGDAEITEIDPQAFQRVTAINLQGMVLTCKHVLPIMREQHGGVICNISSIAAMIDYPYIAYRTSKAGILALTHNVAIRNASYGIRANTILPGLLNTPMAIENRIGVLADTREEVISQRDSKVPLGKQGTGWDVANAALFLASDEAGFITGASLTIDGGQSLVIG
jgi:NAD(P)-dependent dehydrogenase (short-subunit alcohol dehydrogenase family)